MNGLVCCEVFLFLISEGAGGSRGGGDDRHRHTELTQVDSEEEEEEGEDDGGGESDISDDESEMVVLDPDHVSSCYVSKKFNSKQLSKLSLKMFQKVAFNQLD